MAGTEFTYDQFLNIYPDGIENHYWNHARNRIILRFLKKCRIQNEPVLEIGGGRGIVAKFLHEMQVDITGVELADVAPLKGTEGYFFGRTDAFELPEELRKRYTVVLLLDVIEHIKDPKIFIEKVLWSFPNLRHILITVPARQELWTNYDEYNGHYRRYSFTDIKKLATGSFKFYKGSYFNHFLYPIFWIYARWIKNRDTKLIAPTGWKVAVHRIISWTLQGDYILIPERCPGTSLIATFENF